MDRWREVEVFVLTAELGSLSKAAEALGMSNAATSRHLSSLEERLGARLIHRSTRRLTLSEVGESYYSSCRTFLGDMREADTAVNATSLNPTGVLRVSASLFFSVHIAPLLDEYTARYPNVTVHVEVANRYHDLVDDNIDVAIRAREYENDSAIMIRRLAQTRRILTVSPEYLAKHGPPEGVESLSSLPMLIYTYDKSPNDLVLRRGKETAQVKLKGLLESNDGHVLRAAALKGMGILVQPKCVVYDDLIAGRLISVLDEWDMPRLQINLAFQSRRHMSAKVRTFIDFLVEHFHRMDYESKWTSFDRDPVGLEN
ncbi:LysR family transcriptional regulator [Sphingomonas ginsenosidivorax]|uniref:LysR family transcriptional regulator n=1 Tax=Sphingomonas ginsenosidivorax TaxID=862135 RepID=A0A5C6U586_9SPHN|nr:LysR family transcriptional regulator [Sphingomonas ginsenosidivorax]TXC67979.1 LysR family transcriptional regulator [Sphingomonas ginsenosidivorax]